MTTGFECTLYATGTKVNRLSDFFATAMSLSFSLCYQHHSSSRLALSPDFIDTSTPMVTDRRLRQFYRAEGILQLAISFLLLVTLVSISASGQRKKKTDPCANPGTQFEMNQCAGKAYRAADATMNDVYRKLVAMLDEDEKAKLKEAQVAWLKYRDTNCEFVGDQYAGGSIRPLIEATCLADITKSRTTELKAQIKERTL